MNVTVEITSGTLSKGERVEGISTGRYENGHVAFIAKWAGTYDREAPSAWNGEQYHYFTDGHINGVPQANHGFPVWQVAHDCYDNAVPYVSDGPLGHGWECGICGAFLQAG